MNKLCLIPLSFFSVAFDSGYLVCVYPVDELIEDQVETLIYDFGGFVAAAGGNLGLFLGFSCLSVTFAAVDRLVQCLDF